MAFILRALIFIIALLAGAAQAGGIDFTKIATGTKFFYGPKGGQPTVMRVYLHTKNGRATVAHHFVRGAKVRAKPYRLTFHDSAGRMTEMHKLGFDDPLRVTFTPFHCQHSTERMCAHERIATRLKSGEERARQTRNFVVRTRGKTTQIRRGTSNSSRLVLRLKRDARGIETLRDEEGSEALILLLEQPPG